MIRKIEYCFTISVLSEVSGDRYLCFRPVIDIYAFELSREHSPNGGKCQRFANKKGCTANNKE